MQRPKIALIQRSSIIPWMNDEVRAGVDLQRFSDVVQYFSGKPVPAWSAVVVSDQGSSPRAALESAAKVKQAYPFTPIVLVLDNSCEESAIAALRAGVREYLKGPVTGAQLLDAVHRVNGASNPASATAAAERRWVGESQASQTLCAYAAKVAAAKCTVLITGETGTGKDLAAELLHQLSPRREQPFIALNCAAIPDSLLESELFGREKGAYTGADSAYEGRLKLADGGTVFFDEIGDLTPFGQAKLLRVLENRQVQRLGAMSGVAIDIRVIAATNQDLRAMVEKGLFRRDLYYRVNVTHLEIPPLRARRDDILPLVHHFAERFASECGVGLPGLSASARKALLAYDWPGNVRELRNIVEELFVRLPDHPLQAEDLPCEVTGMQREEPIEAPNEKSRIVRALQTTHWNKKRAAERLCWSRMTLYRKMAFHQIQCDDQSELKKSAAAGDAGEV
jgi:DNA-binding NtrC family response regulator